MSEIIIYQTDDGKSKIDVKLENETMWLTQAQMVDLFQTTKQNISLHIKNIFDEGELFVDATVKDYLTVQKEGQREVNRNIAYYNLDMVIAVGYRVKSNIGTQFRIWATNILKEYMIKGFAMDDDRLKQAGGGSYWKELLERIRDIRSSEKVLYRQVLDLYSLSVDYDPKSSESLKFFKIVQNKLHYATHGQTASELIYKRADAQKPFMGLTTFEGTLPTKKEAQIAKNYLDENELKTLNNLVSGYFDLAEVYAKKKQHLYMKDYAQHLDNILNANGDGVLKGAGTVSHKQAMSKVDIEYDKYQEMTLTPVETAYLETIKDLEHKITKNS
ncbi:MAG: virulence RhuM family protein [Alphaproteobacteria bacterium]